MFLFELLYQSKRSKARVGVIHTPHGTIETPHFVPVATNGTMKAVDSVMLDPLQVQLMFCNTYHLMVQPGTDLIEKAGGLHAFMNRSKPVITDSGGFQVFSLLYGGVQNELKSSGQKKTGTMVIGISEEGVKFRSYRNGDYLLLTPESSVAAQKKLGADIIIPFDELPPFHIDQSKLEKSLHRTHRWEKRSLEAHLKDRRQQAMYSVVHGGIDQRLRTLSATLLDSLPFDGHAIGGSLGKNKQQMIDMLSYTVPLLAPEKPRHLLGIGDLASIEPILSLGIDTFDSSYPTKCARHGLLFTFQGSKKAVHKDLTTLFGPIDAGCVCYTCTHYTAAYVQHLFKAHEMIAYTLASIHNIAHMVERVNRYRQAILGGLL
ncbi:tRNA-guanosine(34) transglycosylase [Candidatus Dependentiae bacterium]|nr:MAG: tRNA-guanosine(34) transglycosylase [Candidatus Dependentiae bacterium]